VPRLTLLLSGVEQLRQPYLTRCRCSTLHHTHTGRDGRVNAFYSTPSAYVATKRLMRPKLALKTDDFFPYGGNNQVCVGGAAWLQPHL
jgi:hypothetical protein